LPGLFTPAFKLSLALFIAPAVSVLGKIFSPVSSLFKSETADTRKRSAALRQGITLDELSEALEQTGEDFNDDEKILEGIVNFGNTNVSTIMCPRIDVTAIDMRSGLNQVIQLIISTGFSRIPAYSETFDNVKGILYAKDILPFMSNPDNFKWQSLLREPYFVPETKRISDLLKEFQIKKIHMAVVIDEYGGTAGIVTLEDILEEIVGEITDESDDDKVPYRKIDDHNYVFEGRILLNDIIKILNLGADPFEEVRGESETLAGLILEITGEIPVQKQVVKYKNFTFTIESADRRRIKEVHVEINNDNDKT
jgi:gliding motility-associated protein GldE